MTTYENSAALNQELKENVEVANAINEINDLTKKFQRSNVGELNEAAAVLMFVSQTMTERKLPELIDTLLKKGTLSDEMFAKIKKAIDS
jgi:hypothetical protein